jgi:hypothetical protein
MGFRLLCFGLGIGIAFQFADSLFDNIERILYLLHFFGTGFRIGFELDNLFAPVAGYFFLPRYLAEPDFLFGIAVRAMNFNLEIFVHGETLR